MLLRRTTPVRVSTKTPQPNKKKAESPVRKWVRVAHLWVGMITGLVVFVVSITGCLYVFEEEIRAVTYADFYFVAPRQQAELPVDVILQKAQQLAGNEPLTQLRRKEYQPGGTFQAFLKNGQVLALNPYDGSTVGTLDYSEEWLNVVQKIHTSLLLDDAGEKIIAWSTAAYFLMLLSGIVLWWPKNKKQGKRSFAVKWSASPKRLNYDLHNVVGFYAAWILIVVAITGLWWSFDWVKEGVYGLIGRPSFEERPVSQPAVASQGSVAQFPLERAYRHALTNRQYVRQSFIQLPKAEDSTATYRVLVRYEVPRSLLRNQNTFYFDRHDYKLLREDLYQNYNAADAVRASNYVLHTGSMFGMAGKILAFLASFISASLPVTGFLIWWNKRKKKKSEMRARRNDETTPPVSHEKQSRPPLA